MSFDLTVEFDRVPESLRTEWERAFAAIGFEVEIDPSFDPNSVNGGFVPIRVVRAPIEFVGVSFDQPILSGFDLDFEATSAHFGSPSGRSTVEFALQCFGAATLTRLTGGMYVDPQNGLECGAAEAMLAAEREVRMFIRSSTAEERITRPFVDWSTLD